MPYNALSELPDAVQKMPKHAQEIYMGAYNGAWEQYKDRGKQREALSHATAWAAVEKKYEKKNGRWVAKETKTKEAKMLSDKNRSKLLQAALVTEYKIGQSTPIPKSLTIEEVFGDKVIYDIDGQLYESSYELDEDGKATFGEPQKVLSTKVYRALESASFENTRAILDAALGTHLSLGKEESAYIEDINEKDFVYRRGNQSYQANYTIDEDDKATIGKSVKVLRQVSYKAMEALQTVYSDIIQEAGRRNASLDSKRLKQILSLCQELLSSEQEPDDEKVKDATAKAEESLSWLKEQATMKTEDGESYPAAAFAYVPDPEKASTWKLRLWEDPELKVTRPQLGKAAAALSPGGFRGQKVQIPTDDLSAVKRKIRSEYRKLDVDSEDIPRWVNETMTRELILNYISLSEAKIDKGRAHIIIIKPGFNATEDRYYPAEMLKRDYKVFEGQKQYADHPTESEDKERPERSIKDWVATLSEVKCDAAGVVTGIAEIIEPWFMQKLAALREKGMLNEMGVSINAIGHASKSTIEGKETMVIEELTDCRSVDFVTEPGAGGAVTLYEADRSRDIDLVELSALSERRPDLIKAIEAKVRAEVSKEVKKSMEDKERITELEGENETLTTENTALKGQITEAEKAKAKADAQASIKEAVDKATLPNAAKERLIERFVDAESADGIAEAIQSEIDYIAKLSEASKVKNLGPSQPATEAEEKALREAIKRANPDFTDAQVEVAVSGR